MTNDIRNWSSFALLLIDIQKDFWTADMAAAFPHYESNVTSLLNFCRAENLEVIHLRAQFNPDKSDWMTRYKLSERIPCIDGTPGAEVFQFATNVEGEKVICKQTFDGFQNPELQNHLAERQTRYLLVAGLVTSVCVLLTAAAAAQRGYLVSVISDCCGDSDTAHRHTLDRYPFIFSTVNASQVAECHEKWKAELENLDVIV